jgi:antitoxin ParD1/3/4
MPHRHIVLTDPEFAFLDRLVAKGRYPAVADAVHAALGLLERDETTWENLRLGVLHGYDQILAGTFAAGTGADAVDRAFARALARVGA